MPTRSELKALYKQGVGTLNIDPAFKMTGWRVWSGETRGSSDVWLVTFPNAYDDWLDRNSEITGGGRVFAVRSRTKSW